MILAAGLGTRLRPLTKNQPKALVEVGGESMLDHVARRLVAAGADRLIINLHHFPGQIRRRVAERESWGVEVRFSEEQREPLETGGGLSAAEPHFRKDEPFFLHNSDVLSDLPLREMYAAHLTSGALATLAVMERETSRHLLFDDLGLVGRADESKKLELRARDASGPVRRVGFCGIHVISPTIFSLIDERGAFSILDPYLRLAGTGHRILPFRIDRFSWTDIGEPAQLERARRMVLN